MVPIEQVTLTVRPSPFETPQLWLMPLIICTQTAPEVLKLLVLAFGPTMVITVDPGTHPVLAQDGARFPGAASVVTVSS